MADIYIARDNVCYQLYGSDPSKVQVQYNHDKKYGAKKGECHYHHYDTQSKTVRKWHGFTITRWTKAKKGAEQKTGDIELWSDMYHINQGKYCTQFDGDINQSMVETINTKIESSSMYSLDEGACQGYENIAAPTR